MTERGRERYPNSHPVGGVWQSSRSLLRPQPTTPKDWSPGNIRSGVLSHCRDGESINHEPIIEQFYVTVGVINVDSLNSLIGTAQ